MKEFVLMNLANVSNLAKLFSKNTLILLVSNTNYHAYTKIKQPKFIINMFNMLLSNIN